MQTKLRQANCVLTILKAAVSLVLISLAAKTDMPKEFKKLKDI